MIFRCENCINNADCCENQKEYKALCDAIEELKKHDIANGKYHCWFSLTLKCDYFIEDQSTVDFRGCSANPSR